MTRPGSGQWSQMWAAMSAALASAVPPEVRAEEHLATDAIVAFVDGELGLSAHERAARHLSRCPSCTAEVAAQRQARTAVRDAGAPAIPQSLLAALHTIPLRAPLDPSPDQLAVTDDGQLVVVQRPVEGRTPLGGGEPLGSVGLGGTTTNGLAGVRRRTTRRARQGAGVLVSGLVVGALVLAAPVEQAAPDIVPGSPRPGSVGGGGTPAAPELARLELQRRDAADRPAPTGPAMAVR
jgi:hypothetical protein